MRPEDVEYIIMHCTATPEGRVVTLEDVRRWHVEERGWSDIGYHWLIELDGTLRQGRHETTQGAHAKGYNSNSIGVCYVGGMNREFTKAKDTRTEAQKLTLRCLIEGLRGRYPNAKIIGHRDVSAKACPSFNARMEYNSL